ncbi:hypothetical protein [Nocardia ignorata]|uniref:DUF3320 domain-containing protein n=1 Tax=Nocardia ignorata TaxID=145285 RepID=A0A4R6PUF1_NOCIG|nr:hypothetical protein [Nocardia ignorata]TDP42172.1 hypothetical protein DFR75_1011282 [Nocardia ignorata]
MQWVGRIGWVVGLLAGAFGVLLGSVGYFTGIGNDSPFEITLAVVFFGSGCALAGVSIWQLVIGDRHKRRGYPRQTWHTPPAGVPYAGGSGSAQVGPGHSHVGPVASGPSYFGSPPAGHAPDAQPLVGPEPPVTPPKPLLHAAYTPPSAPIAATVAQTPEWVTSTRSIHHWLPTGIPYASAPTSVLGSPVDLDRDSAATIPVRVRDAVRELIAIEGPIERGRLVMLVAQRFGVPKPSEKQQICVLGQVPEELVRATPHGVFVWSSNVDPGTWRGFRFTPPGTTRPIETICGEEIANAITHVAQHNRPTFDDLVWSTLTQFAHERTGIAEDRIEAALTLATRRGRLTTDPDGRYRPLS